MIFEGVYALHPDIGKSPDFWIAAAIPANNNLVLYVESLNCIRNPGLVGVWENILQMNG